MLDHLPKPLLATAALAAAWPAGAWSGTASARFSVTIVLTTAAACRVNTGADVIECTAGAPQTSAASAAPAARPVPTSYRIPKTGLPELAHVGGLAAAQTTYRVVDREGCHYLEMTLAW